MRAVWIQAAHALVRSRQPNAQPLQRWSSRVAHRGGSRTALAAVPLAILSALMFSPAVLSTLTSISVTPKNQNISTGQTQQYTATGTYGYASTNNITNQMTWSSSNTSLATINSSGLATAVAAGTTTISATLSGKTGSASLTVSNPIATGVFCGGSNAVATLPNCDPNNPTANTVFDTTLPDTSSYTVVQVNTGGDLQTAINNASCSPNGTVIKLQAGATSSSGPYNLPNRTCAAGQWIIIQSDSSSIPAPGTRVSPSDAGNMPKIQSTGGLPSITASQGANHYRFIGVEFNAVYPGIEVVALIDLDAGFTSISQEAKYIIFDRCYIHGDTNLSHDYRRGISLQVQFGAVIDSYINQFHDTNTDSQTVTTWNGTGPFKIVNNYLSASGENFISGGSGTTIVGQTPADFEIRHNHFFKPTVWRGTAIVTKNLFELKNAQRVLVDGNVFEYTWLSGQTGFALVFTPAQFQDGPQAKVVDVTFTHNIVRHAASGLQLTGGDVGSGLGVQRALFQNNLFDDINGTTWGPDAAGTFAQTGPNGSTGYPQTIVYDHNTIFESGGQLSSAYTFYSSGVVRFVITKFKFTNNIINHGKKGILDGDRGLSDGTPTLSSYCPGGYVWNKNVIINGTALASIYPAGTLFAVPNQTAVKFANFGGADYRLCQGVGNPLPGCAGASPYALAGTDGKNIGADINSINSATAGVIHVHD